MDAGGNIYSLVEYYYLYRRDYRTPELSHDFNSSEPFLMEDKEWFDKLLPICQWGCHHEALVDCSKPNFPVIHFVGYGGALLLEYPTFEGWIEAWIRGDDLWQTIANKLRNEDD